MQSASQDELHELKNRVIMLEEMIQKFYQQPPPMQNMTSFPQSMPPLNQFNMPPVGNDTSIQVIPRGQTIIYGVPQNMNHMEHRQDETTKYGSPNKGKVLR